MLIIEYLKTQKIALRPFNLIILSTFSLLYILAKKLWIGTIKTKVNVQINIKINKDVKYILDRYLYTKSIEENNSISIIGAAM